MTYEQYVKSNRWKKRTRAARKLFKRCMWCGDRNGLKTIHRHRERLGRENMLTDLSVFCRSCLKKLGYDSKLVLNENRPKAQLN